ARAESPTGRATCALAVLQQLAQPLTYRRGCVRDGGGFDDSADEVALAVRTNRWTGSALLILDHGDAPWLARESLAAAGCFLMAPDVGSDQGPQIPGDGPVHRLGNGAHGLEFLGGQNDLTKVLALLRRALWCGLHRCTPGIWLRLDQDR